MHSAAQLDPEPDASLPQRQPAPLAELMRFASHGALELLRGAAREPRVARHFNRLDPFGHVPAPEAFGRAVLGLALWLGKRLGPGDRRSWQAAAARPPRHGGSNGWVDGLEEESELYGDLEYRYALERFARRAVDLLGLDEADRWAAQMLLVRTLAQPVRERVERLLRDVPGGRSAGDALAQPA